MGPHCRPPSVLAGVLAAVVLGGCGSGGGAPVVSAGAAAQMRGHLAELRTAVAAHDPAGATRQLDAFAADVGRAHAAGRLRSADYAALLTAIARTRAQIAAEVIGPAPATTVSAPAPATTVSVPAAPAAPAPAAPPAGPGAAKAKRQAKQDHGKGHGKNKGGD